MKTPTPAQRGALLRNDLMASVNGQQMLMHLSAPADAQQNRDIFPGWEQEWTQTWEQTWVAQNSAYSEEEDRPLVYGT